MLFQSCLQTAEASNKLHDIVAPVANRLGAALVPLKSMVSCSDAQASPSFSAVYHFRAICH